MLPDNTDVDITPHVAGIDFYTFTDPPQEYTLIHLTKAKALTNPDPTRTTIGVGEEVDFSGMPDDTTWKESTGTIIPAPTGSTYKFIAPSGKGQVTVTASISNRANASVVFTVLEPTGVDHAVIIATNNIGGYAPDGYPQGAAGAEMRLRVFMAPTYVSFGNVEMEEVVQNATDITGYFTNAVWFTDNPALFLRHSSAFADWFQFGEDNSWVDTCWSYNAPVSSGGPGLPQLPQVGGWSSGGHFTWFVPWNWGVPNNSGYVYANSGANPWYQVFSIDGSGTVIITKFSNCWVQRTTNNVITNSP
jgi:hypothetical protein